MRAWLKRSSPALENFSWPFWLLPLRIVLSLRRLRMVDGASLVVHAGLIVVRRRRRLRLFGHGDRVAPCGDAPSVERPRSSRVGMSFPVGQSASAPVVPTAVASASVRVLKGTLLAVSR